MDRCAWNGQGHGRKQGGAAGLHQNPVCQETGKPGNNGSQSQGQSKGNDKSREERFFCLVPVGGREPGDGRLDGAGADGKTDPVNREDHLINAQSLGSDGAGQENTIEKPKDPGCKARQSEDQGAGRQGVFF